MDHELALPGKLTPGNPLARYDGLLNPSGGSLPIDAD
jgi:hypothetical protein